MLFDPVVVLPAAFSDELTTNCPGVSPLVISVIVSLTMPMVTFTRVTVTLVASTVGPVARALAPPARVVDAKPVAVEEAVRMRPVCPTMPVELAVALTAGAL
jgi:hypothetical protein